MEQLLPLLTDPRVLAMLSPVITALIKKGTDKLPSWALPIVTVLASTVLAALGNATSPDGSVESMAAQGIVGGLLGVGVREGVDQLGVKPIKNYLGK